MRRQPTWASLTAAAFLLPVLAQADSGMRVGEILNSEEGAQIEVKNIEVCDPLNFTTSQLEFSAAGDSQLSCTRRDRIVDALKVTQIQLTLAGLLTACSGVGSVVTISFGTLAASLGYAELKVSHLPCEDRESEDRIKRKIDRTVCEQLMKRGFECNPEDL